MTRFFAIAIAAASVGAAADSGGLAGPVAGFVLDRRAAVIRPIQGLPGAARLGVDLPLPFAVSRAATVARRDYALVAPASGGAPVLVRGLRADVPRIVELPGAIEASAIAVAASGDSAILYSDSTRRAQFLDGLPDAPRVLDPVDTTLVGSAAVLALDSAGASALLAAPDGQIYRLRPGSDPVAVARLAGASSLSFLPGRDAALAASAESGNVLLLENLDGALSIRSVAAPAGLDKIRAVQALDGGTAAVISGDGRLAALDLETGSLEWIPLAAEAENFEPIDRSLFVLNRGDDAPLLLFDAASGRSAWFVPPIRPAARPRGQGKALVRGEDRPR